MGDKGPAQDLTSPHITRAPSAASTATMEIITESWFDGDRKSGDSWGPPIIHRKDDAWQEDKSPVVPKYTSQKQLLTEKWVNDSTPAPKRKENSHPVSEGTRDFLASLVNTMRAGGSSNTTVMSLLNKPVSVFEEPELTGSKDLDLTEQNKINKELEEFLQQIREIRDGPPQPTIEGALVDEIGAQLSEQKTAVEEALAALDRELTQDSGTNGSVAQHEEEYKKILVERESRITSQGSVSAADHMSESDQITRSNTQCTITTQQTDGDALEDGLSVKEESPAPVRHKKMTLYELLALHPDPKVRKAANKMKRLDEKLRLVIQKEKEVKKQHELLNKQILLYSSGAGLIEPSETKDEGEDNLTLITELKSDVTPIFATQTVDTESETCSLPPLSGTESLTSRSSTTPRDKTRNQSRDQSRYQARDQARGGRSRGTPQSKQSNFSKKEDRKRANNKNFIARNKELANDAAAVVAMTEQEKQRLNELLRDVDTEENTEKTVAVIEGGGFKASLEEETRLREIESLLIVEEGSSMSVCSGQTNSTLLSIPSSAVTELNDRCKVAESSRKLGETALKTLNEKRSEEERLNMIDEMLARITSDDQEDLPEVPRSVLDELLTQCRTETAKQAEEVL